MHDSISKFARRSILSFTIALAFTGSVILAGCHQSVSAAQQADDSGPDPADANMAPVDGSQPDTAPAPQDESQQGQLQPSTGGAPVYRSAPPQNESQQSADEYNQDQTQGSQQQADDPAYDDQVAAGQAALDDEEAPAAPPELPTYDQPEAPGPDYIWTPGYWGYAPGGYYWIPGVWCSAPYYGALWTPGYWYFWSGAFRFHRGYWGPYIGFYGGINYGFGYSGTGYYGGYWRGQHFYYNTAVNRVNVRHVTYVYNRTVVVNNHTRVAYNGGHGGIAARPTMSQVVAMHQTRTAPMTMQVQNQRNAAQNRQQFFNQNRGRPAIAAAPKPIAADHGIQRPAIRPASQIRPAVRPNQPQNRPNQQSRPGQPQVRPNQPQIRPDRPQVQPNQPQVRPNQPRPNQPQVRPAPQPNPQRPQVRPEAPQTRPQPQARPDTQFRQPQQRPSEPRPQYNRPAPQQRESQPRPQQQQRTERQPSQQSHPAPQHDDHH